MDQHKFVPCPEKEDGLKCVRCHYHDGNGFCAELENHEDHGEPSKASQLVDAIIEDLSDRRGLRHEWEQIDEEVQDEIKAAWLKIAQDIYGFV